MNTKARETLKADLIAGRGSEKLEEKKKGKAFVEALDNCKDTKDIVNLLCRTMPLNVIKDRLNYTTDNPLVLNFRKAAMIVNINQGYEPRHGDLVMLAVEKGSHFEGSVANFKARLSHDISQREIALKAATDAEAIG